MSLIHYKFRAAKDFSSITFEGLSLSLFELKKEILLAKKLKGTDFDIVISNAQTNEEYSDDQTLIPKNTNVFVKRVPASGKFNAQYYLNSVSAAVPSTAATSGGGISLISGGSNSSGGLFGQTSSSAPTLSGGVLPGENEDEKIDAMMKQNFEQFDKQTDQMAANNPMSKRTQNYNNKFNNMRNNAQLANRPPPPNYVCFRCGERGHYITFCPTHGEKKFDQPKVKRTTGIPRSFLRTVEKPPEGKGVMITSDGDLVVAQANDTAWQQHRQRAVGNSTNIDDMRADIPAPIDLQCKICKLLLKEPVSTPCCSSLFCTECITDELVRPQNGEKFRCPQCQSTNIVPDSLVTEPEINQRVNQVTRDYISAKQKEAVESKTGLDSDEHEQNDEENNSQQLDDQPILDGDNANGNSENNEDSESQGNSNPKQQVKSFMSDIMAPNQHYNRPRPPPNQFQPMMFPPPNMINGQFRPPPMPFRPDSNPPPLRWTREGGLSDHKDNENSKQGNGDRNSQENGKNSKDSRNRSPSPRSRSRSGRQDRTQSPRGSNRGGRADRSVDRDRRRSISRESRRSYRRSPSPKRNRRSELKGDSYRPSRSRSRSRDRRTDSRRGSGSESDRLSRRRADDIPIRGDCYRPERSRSPISKRLSGVRDDIGDRLGNRGGRRRGMDSFRPDRDRPARDSYEPRDSGRRRPIEERLEERGSSRRRR